jgi:hypothetical protein
MHLRSLVIFGLILISLVLIYFVNRYLQKIIKPRLSLTRLFLYFLTAFALVFIYTGLLVFAVVHLFPLH